MAAEPKTQEPKKTEVGVLPKGTQRKPGWEPVAGPFEGRKRPDGLGRGWC